MQKALSAPTPLMRFFVALAKSQNISCPITDWRSTDGQIDKWLLQIDAAVSPSILRQFMQSDETVCDEITLGSVIRRYHGNAQWNDKLYVAVAEYLVNCSPKWFQETERVTLAHVAEVLKPVLGPAGELPSWLPELEELIDELSAYEHLHELADHEIFDRGRQLKARVAKGGLDTM